jgi:Zn-dependent protease with chaperone function
VARAAELRRVAWWAIPLRFLLTGPGTALVLGLVFLPTWGFWRVAAVALVIQLPPNLLIHHVSSSLPRDFFAEQEKQEGTDGQHRQVDAVVAEIAARAGVEPPAVWLTRSIPKTSGAGIFERRLEINPGFYSALSKQARRALIAHELAHQYDKTSRERLAADLAIFIPAGIAYAAITLTLLGRLPVDATLFAYAAVATFGTYVHAKLSRINERQADLLATDILGEKDSMLALCRELSKRHPDPRELGRRARLLRTHPNWRKRRLALERHKVRPHPRRLWRLIDHLVALIPALAFISALAVVAYWLTGQG